MDVAPPDSPPPSPRSARRRGPWVGALLALVAGLTALTVGGGLWALNHLETPAIRKRVRAEINARLGVVVDYERLGVSPFGGIVVRGLSVASPDDCRQIAPELAHLGSLEVDWDLGALLSGVPRIERVALGGVRARVVVDRDSGRTSLQGLTEGFPKTATGAPESAGDQGAGSDPKPPTSLSALLGSVVVPEGLHVGSMRLSDVRVEVFEVAGGRTVRKMELGGMEVQARLDAQAGAFSALLELGSSPEGMAARVVDEGGDRQVVVRPAWTVTVDSRTGVGVEGGLALVRQSFDERLPPAGQIVDFKIAATFAPDRGRTRLEVDRLRVLDGLGSVRADVSALDVPGGGVAPGALTMSASIDVGRLLALAPEGWAPATLQAGRVGVDLKDLTLDPRTFMPTGGSFSLSADLEDVQASEGRLASVEVRASGARSDEAFSLDASWVGEGISARASRASVGLGSARIDLALRDLVPDLDNPLSSKAKTSIRGAIHELTVTTPGGEVLAERIELSAQASDPWRPPHAGTLRIPIEGLRVRGPRGRTLLDRTDGGVTVEATDVIPVQRRGSVKADLELGAIGAHLEASNAQSLTYAATMQTPSLGILRPFAPPKLGVAWERLGLSLKASGVVRRPFQPRRMRAEHATHLRLTDVSVRRGELRASAAGMELDLRGEGGSRSHTVKATLGLESPRFKDWKGGRRHDLSVQAGFDLDAPRGNLVATLKGGPGPHLDLSFDAEYDRGSRRVTHNASVKASELGGLDPLVPPALRERHALKLQGLTLEASSEGIAEGVVTGMRRGTQPVLADNPAAAFRGRQKAKFRVRGLEYAGAEAALTTPGGTLELEVAVDDDGATPALRFNSPGMRLSSRGRNVAVTRVDVEASARVDALPAPEAVDFRVEATVDEVEQEVVVGYPMGAVSLSARGRAEKERLLRIDSFTVRNERGGTALDLSCAVQMGGAGGAGLVPGREAVEVEGALSQDLKPLSRMPQWGDVAGEVGMRVQASSGDRRRFRVAATMSAEGVDIDLPAQGVSVVGVDGDLPLLQEILIDEQNRPRLVMGARADAWSRSRFQDVHPFLAGDNFLSLRRMTVRGRSVGPVAGNVRLDRNLLAVDQLQAQLMGGAVTGQLLVDATSGAREVRFRGTVTGIEPTRGDDKLDANAAIVLRPDSLDLEGRVQLVRIGRQHMLDMLDVIDPFAEDVSINQARLALRVGHPERVRLRFDDGFLSARLQLGGLAGLAKISDIRGVPMGPPLQRDLGPLLDAQGGRP